MIQSTISAKPFRDNSDYSTIYEYLLSKRRTGVNRQVAVKELAALLGKEERLVRYSLNIVTSPTRYGHAHKSCKNGLDVYWVEKRNDFIKLCLWSETNDKERK